MEEKILENLDNPEALESLFRQHSEEFRKTFPLVFQKYPDHLLLQAWHYRLQSEKRTITWGTLRERLTVGVLALLFIPILHIIYSPLDESGDLFLRNLSLILFGSVSIYFLIRCFVYKPLIWVPLIIFTSFAFYINLNIVTTQSPTYYLIHLHIPVLLWMLAGIAYSYPYIWDYKQWINYLRYNGEWIIFTTLLSISAFLLIALTHALFGLIQIKFANVVGERFFIWTALVVPLVAAWLTINNSHLVEHISPAIARIFAPLLTFSILAFLTMLSLSGQSLFNDRNLLLIFNVLILGVLAIIVFTLTGYETENHQKSHLWLIEILLLITLILNSIALVGIIFRISVWGITPNRLAVMGINFLMMLHLALIGYPLFMSLVRKHPLVNVGKVVVRFLPFYAAWVLIVVFVFPFVFQ